MPRDEAERVLQQVKQHVAVASADLLERAPAGGFTILARFAVNLPSRARAAGHTKEGVRSEEPVTLRFPANWPRRAPRLTLRPTFPAHLAHTNRHKHGEPIPPCIVEAGDTDELLHARGLDGVLDQLAHWLARAAGGVLADYGEGWEPMRRESQTGSIKVDAKALIASLPTDGAISKTGADYFGTKGWLILEPTLPVTPASTFSMRLRREKWWSGSTAVFAARAALDGRGPRIFDRYQPDTASTLEDLLELAAAIGIDATALRGSITEYFTQSLASCDGDPAEQWANSFVVGVVLGVERPAPIAGSNGETTELIPFIVRLDASLLGAAFAKHAMVEPAMHSQPADARLLRSLSGYDDGGADTDAKLVILGSGSLGSKVATHLARAGFGTLTVVDKGYMRPHNAARHSLYATSGNKAEELKKALAEIGQKQVTAVTDDACTLLAGEGATFAQTFPSDASMLIDTTASAAVLSSLITSNSLTASGLRIARAVMYGQGRVAVLMLEGPARSVRVDDHVGALFARAAADSRLRAALLGDGTGLAAVFVGQNCRSMTMKMADSVVSRSAACSALQIEQWLTSGLPPEGALALGLAEPGGVGMIWTAAKMRPTVTLTAGYWTVRILADVAERVLADAKHWGMLETGGGLLGSISHETKTIVIAALLEAPPDSIRAPAKFVLGTQNLVEAVRAAAHNSLGYLSFVGTWHSHPSGGKHSSIDLATLAGLALQARGSPAVSLVWEPGGFRVEVGMALR